MNDNGANLNQNTPDVVNDGVATTVNTDGAEGASTTPASNQTVGKKWMSVLPDDLKGNEILAQHDSIGDAIKALLDGSKDVTGNAEPTKEQEENPVEYKFSKDLSDSDDPDGAIRNAVKDAIKNMNLSQDEADKVYSSFVDTVNGIEESVRKNASEKCEQELKTAWGDKYDENMGAWQRAYQTLVPEGSELEKGLKATMAENNPYVIQLLAEVGKSVKEHVPPLSKGVGKVEQNQGFLSRGNEKYPW